MAPRGTLVVFDADRPAALEDAMPTLMLPETFVPIAAAFAPCFTAPTYRVFRFLVAGWVQCGERLPTPQAMAAARAARGTWHRLRVTLYGKTVAPLVFRGTALWYGALRAGPVRFVVVRDPSGRRRDEAFFCTDPTAGAAFLLTTYAKRWALEVAIHDCKQHLGFEDAQNQTGQAGRRTAPFAGLVYALVALWGAREVADGRAPRWVVRPWYRHKASLSFADLLAAFRQASVCRVAPPLSAAPRPPRRPRNARRCVSLTTATPARSPRPRPQKGGTRA